MTADVLQLRRDLAQIEAQAGHAGLCFFAHLARLDPALAGLFPRSDDARTQTLLGLLRALCDGAGDAATARSECRRLGRDYAALGLREDHYDPLGTALLIALHELLGGAFTARAEDAWAGIYGEFAEGMIAAGTASGP